MASLSFCQLFNLDLLKASATLTLAELWLSLGSNHAKRALTLIHGALPIILGVDIRLKFDNLAVADARRPPLSAEEAADHAMAAKNMSRLWATFARTSQPAAPGQPEWPAYDLQKRATMMIEARCHVANDPYPGERQVWTEL